MRREKWIETVKRADFKEWGRELGVSPLLARLIRNRGIETVEEAKKYLYGTPADFADPLLYKDMEKAVSIILETVGRRSSGNQEAPEDGETVGRRSSGNQEAPEYRETEGKSAEVSTPAGKIAIVSDFDDDGIFAGEILYEGLKRIGADVNIYTPSRVREGYGINRRIIDEAKADGCTLILTCDNGIAAIDEVRYAKERGFRVIVTDHHEVQYSERENGRAYHIPEADAIVDAKQPGCGYPFKERCGAGVAMRLIEVLFQRCGVGEEALEPFYEYAAIATVADVVELRSENRILVKEGLKRLRRTKNAGLRALFEACSLDPQSINSYHLGFVVGPSFNAVGRLSEVRLAFDLLQEKDPARARELALRIRELNEERKNMTELGRIKAEQTIEDAPWKNDRVLLVALQDVHESVVGIIAGKLKEKYNRPVFVFTEGSMNADSSAPEKEAAGNSVSDADGEARGPAGSAVFLKGSGRSIPAYPMVDELMKVSDLPERFGGHKMAAGLTIRKENLEELRNRLNAICTLTEEELFPVISFDAQAPLDYWNFERIEELQLLEPFGTGNPKPAFTRPHFNLRTAAVIGRSRNVLKMTVTETSDIAHEAIMFGEPEDFLTMLRAEYGEEETRALLNRQENRCDAAFLYYPDINEFRGNRSIQFVCRNYCVIPQKMI